MFVERIDFLIQCETGGQLRPKLIGILRGLSVICGGNVENLTWIGGEWLCGHHQIGVNLDLNVKFDLEN